MEITTWESPTRVDDLDGGGQRRVLAYTDELMIVHYSLTEGDTGEPHAHEETTQASFVIDGRLELVGEASRKLTAGDSYVIPPGTVHGVRAVTDCTVVDVFSPPLDAYLPE